MSNATDYGNGFQEGFRTYTLAAVTRAIENGHFDQLEWGSHVRHPHCILVRIDPRDPSKDILIERETPGGITEYRITAAGTLPDLAAHRDPDFAEEYQKQLVEAQHSYAGFYQQHDASPEHEHVTAAANDEPGMLGAISPFAPPPHGVQDPNILLYVINPLHGQEPSDPAQSPSRRP